MSVVVVTPPPLLVDLPTVKQHMRVDVNDDDNLIKLYIAAACAMIDGPGGWLGRCIGTQTLELRLDGFARPIWAWSGDSEGLFWNASPALDVGYGVGWPQGRVALPFPPMIEVISVTYEDASGTPVTLPSAAYLATDQGLDASFGTTLPAGRWEANAVKIRYTAGYITPPGSIVAAVLLMVGDLYANRQTVETGLRAAAVQIPMSATVQALLAPFRVY